MHVLQFVEMNTHLIVEKRIKTKQLNIAQGPEPLCSRGLSGGWPAPAFVRWYLCAACSGTALRRFRPVPPSKKESADSLVWRYPHSHPARQKGLQGWTPGEGLSPRTGFSPRAAGSGGTAARHAPGRPAGVRPPRANAGCKAWHGPRPRHRPGRFAQWLRPAVPR